MNLKEHARSAPAREAHLEEYPLAKLREWDPDWADKYFRMVTNPWTNGLLPLKDIELMCIGINVACANLCEAGVRRHIRAALKAGATRAEILIILKGGAMLSIHSCSLGAPILLQEAEAVGAELANRGKVEPTPFCDKFRQSGMWNTAWDPFFKVDPVWTDQFFAAAASIYSGGVLTPKLVELLSIAIDASITHMYAPGTRHHIQGALKAGASMEEIMEVLKVCVSVGAESCYLGVPILADELERIEAEV
jgi:alkylhydroperoxidase/carboxymuconolactone decarboxylase family protein YurZ